MTRRSKKPVVLDDEAYLEIEEALSATARGRAFLREHQRRSRVIAADEVRRTVHKLRDVWETSERQAASESRLDVLRQELQDMATAISDAKSQIAALQPEESADNRIMQAAGELDAIVTATERATNDILNAGERLQDQVDPIRGAGLDEVAETVEREIAAIFEACSFQDITGQRTTKVVAALRYVEQRVAAMVSIWGVEGVSEAFSGAEDSREDAHLLNGPQAEGEGVAQDEIDRLLAEDESESPFGQDAIDGLFDDEPAAATA